MKNDQAYYALKNISLNIEKGDFITVIGGNGAGKSTLLNALAGTFFLDSGKIIIDEQDVTQLPEHKRAKQISRVFQDPSLGTAPRMTILENMALAYRRGKKRTLKRGHSHDEKEFFKQQLASLNLNLETRLESEVGVLSGGQRQAIALIMATLHSPELLLLDEHTAALDPKTQRMIMELTHQIIKNNHLTSLMITHHLPDALHYGNRLIVLHRGEIVKDFNEEEKKALHVTDLYELLLTLDERM
nr:MULTISPECIES: ATP-binding cassette domain-containing protein [unclassified Granulicatella]